MQFTAVAVVSFLASIAAAAVPVCTTSDNAPFLADAQVALDTLPVSTVSCDTPGSTKIDNFVLSAVIRTYSETDKVFCIDHDAIEDGAAAIIAACQFTPTSGGATRVEGYLDLGNGDEVSVEWSACGGSCRGAKN